jgi:hypothetical protein
VDPSVTDPPEESVLDVRSLSESKLEIGDAPKGRRTGGAWGMVGCGCEGRTTLGQNC